MSYYGTSRTALGQHTGEHQANSSLPNQARRTYCLICYPRPLLIPSTFITFWTWISHVQGANKNTGYTIAAFKYFSDIYDLPDTTLANLVDTTVALLNSIRFRNLNTPIVELSFYFHAIYEETNGYTRPVTPQITTQVRNRFHNSVNSLPPVNNPIVPINNPAQPLNQALNMATGNEIKAALEGIFGVAGARLTTEKSTMKVDLFY